MLKKIAYTIVQWQTVKIKSFTCFLKKPFSFGYFYPVYNLVDPPFPPPLVGPSVHVLPSPPVLLLLLSPASRRRKEPAAGLFCSDRGREKILSVFSEGIGQFSRQIGMLLFPIPSKKRFF